MIIKKQIEKYKKTQRIMKQCVVREEMTQIERQKIKIILKPETTKKDKY